MDSKKKEKKTVDCIHTETIFHSPTDNPPVFLTNQASLQNSEEDTPSDRAAGILTYPTVPRPFEDTIYATHKHDGMYHLLQHESVETRGAGKCDYFRKRFCYCHEALFGAYCVLSIHVFIAKRQYNYEKEKVIYQYKTAYNWALSFKHYEARSTVDTCL